MGVVTGSARAVGKWALAGLVSCLAVASPASAAPGDIELLSVDIAGRPPLGFAGSGDLSFDGRYALLLVDDQHKLVGDLAANQYTLLDVAVRDRQAGTTKVISLGPAGQRANDWSLDNRLTPDGRFAAFDSKADNLVANDTNPRRPEFYEGMDVFVRDLQSGVTELVSIAPNGQQPNGSSRIAAISADARYVAFNAYGTNIAGGRGSFIRDRHTGTTARLPDSDYTSALDLSGDGRYVLFLSYASDLVPNDTNGKGDLFVLDREANVIERVNLLPDGSQTNDYTWGGNLSADGHYVAFEFNRTIYVRDVWANTTKVASVAANGGDANGWSSDAQLSADGRYVAFVSAASNLVAGDTDGGQDLFRRDLVAGVNELVSRNPAGEPVGGSAIRGFSGDGRFVADETSGQLLPIDTDREFDAYLYEAGAGALAKIGYTVKPDSLNFGAQTIGTSRTLSFRLKNTGERALVFDYPSTIFLKSVDSANQFTMTNGCPRTVAIGASCTISITFKPTSVGEKLARLRVIVEGVGRTRKISGTGVAP